MTPREFIDKHLQDDSQFKAWLLRFGSHDIVGNAQLPDDCPIGMFAKAVGFERPCIGSVGIGEYTQSGYTSVVQAIKPPAWVTNFIRQVDQCHSRGHGVKASDAFAYLD
jgi:hypothetical protein